MTVRSNNRGPFIKSEGYVYSIFETAWGYVALSGRQGRLSRVILPDPDKTVILRELAEPGVAIARNDRLFGEIRERLTDYFAGREGEFWDIDLEMDWAGEFTYRVLDYCRKIGFGCTLTYGEFAAKLGKPGAARVVGQALARNRLPVVIPCHRVIAADGSVGGYSARGGAAMKQRLLSLEKAYGNRR